MPGLELKKLRDRIDRYLARTGMSRTTFGREAAGSPNLMTRIDLGKIKWETIERVQAYLDKNGG